MKKIFLMIGIGSFLFGTETSQFISLNGVVTDHKTSLEWQDNTTGTTRSWTSAIGYCESLTLNGLTDWRLPNKKELLSIVDYRKSSPSINPIFIKTTSSNYWSSTTDTQAISSAWRVSFDNGRTYTYLKSYSAQVRCVRSGQ